MNRANSQPLTVIDLFCGVGGLSCGFVQEDFKILAGIDNDISCKYAFEKNNNSKFIAKDIRNVTGVEINELFENNIKILVGCAPCQPFSSYSFRYKEKDQNKWGLLYEFIRIIKETKPAIVSMENVPQLLHFKKAPVFDDFCQQLKKIGYFISYQVVYCPDYGIPQARKRLVLLASLFGEINLIDRTHDCKNYITVRDTISNLPKLQAGEADTKDALHKARVLKSINLKRIKATKEGGTWADWPENLKLKCHLRSSGKTYKSVYGRMKWDQPAPTMTTHCTGFGNGRFGHPEQDRAITLREAALFQSFPINYCFFENEKSINTAKISRHIGNAVPPKLGSIIAKSIKLHLEKFNKI